MTFGESTMSRTQVRLRFNRLKEGRGSVNDDFRPDLPCILTTNENNETVKKIILYNHQITIRDVADDVGISFGSCQTIFPNFLGMRHATSKIVPKLLNFQQK